MLIDKIITVLFIAIILASCSIQGLTNDYSKLSASQKSIIHELSSFENLKKGHVYVLNGTILKKELLNHPKALVYTFANGCPSDNCKPLSTYVSYARKNGCSLFMVMVGYSNLNESIKQNVDVPLFSIDNDHYNTKNRTKYVIRFENDIMNLPLDSKPKKYLGSLFFFENGVFKEVKKNLN